MAETTQTIREIFRNALLAQAACADLTSAVRNASGWQTALGAGQAPMNGAMAQYFASKFTALAFMDTQLVWLLGRANGWSGSLAEALATRAPLVDEPAAGSRPNVMGQRWKSWNKIPGSGLKPARK